MKTVSRNLKVAQGSLDISVVVLAMEAMGIITVLGVRHRTGRIARFVARKENMAMLPAPWPWASWQRCP
jgi:hypothetical protein